MFLGPWDQGSPWNSRGIEGISRFLNRVWNLLHGAPAGEVKDLAAARKELRRATHHAVKEVTLDLKEFHFNTAIAELMTLQSAISRCRTAEMMEQPEWQQAVRTLLTMLAPIAPHISEELWHRLGETGSVHLQPWPEHDPAELVQETVRMAVQVSGKVRGQIEVAADADRYDVLAAARQEDNVARHLEGTEVIREIVVPGRLVNFVVRPA